MDKSILMQKQVKNNAEDLQKEFLDMKNWEEQMKRKDDELRKERNYQVTLPPIRTKHKNKIKKISKKINEIDTKSKKIKSYDYSAWDKFDVDKACKEIDEEEYSYSDESEDESISKEQLEKAHQEATKHKNEGNIFVQQEKWSKAIGCYSNAIKIFPHDAIFYANRALCQLKLDNFYSAESDCSAAIQLDETYIKAYHRRAIARMNLKQYKEAKLDLEKILKLEPFNKEAKLLFNQIENKIKYSKTSTEVEENIKKLSKNTTFEKKIAEKMWNKTTLNIQTANIKNTEINYMEDDKNIKDIINNKNKKDKKDNVHDIDIKNKRDPRIPDWLPEKDNVIVIEPIQKPPHLHSKKSLIKIPIQEMEFVISHNYINDKTMCIENDQQKKEFSKDNNLIKNNNVKIIKSLEDISTIPPIPKTAVQFIMNWKTNKSPEFRYKYLKQLPKDSLPKIFQDSMESDIFCEIIEILKIEFIRKKDLIFHYLKDLSQVKRFRTFIMFISDNDKKSLKILFEYCKTVENVPQDEISILEDKYEIKK
ncbi:RNA polymerase II-associated protein 3 [Apis laboriosa]|uniref:RNA polymerase II-associated protein 3 n=1 Tax=Apis laboriosa TaxID=183418 RepID=UPI001CC8205C|nr:RNA polymerase II-associated protein 3 [Apis laboriosa]XP_043802646.1 RNA polymerase II-associated protein 3 [Apis laboriosa]